MEKECHYFPIKCPQECGRERIPRKEVIRFLVFVIIIESKIINHGFTYYTWNNFSIHIA